MPVLPSPSRFQNADRVGLNIGREYLFLVRGNHQHVGGVLAGSLDPINALAAGIIPGHNFIHFGREVDLAMALHHAMRSAQSSDVVPANFFPGRQINNREAVAGNLRAVVADKSGFAVFRYSEFMGSGSRRHLSNHLLCDRIHNQQLGRRLAQHE